MKTNLIDQPESFQKKLDDLKHKLEHFHPHDEFSGIINPSSGAHRDNPVKRQAQKKGAENGIQYYKNEFVFQFSDPDIAKSPRIEIIPKNCQNDTINMIHLIKFDFDWMTCPIDDHTQKCRDNNAVYIAFNIYLPTLFDFKGRDYAINNCILEVQRILDRGVDPKNIILEGNCIAASYATLTAKHFYDKGIIVNLFNDRSFAKSDIVVSGHLLEEHTNYNFLKNLFAKFIFRPLENSIISIRNLSMNPGQDFYDLYSKNPDRINYIVYRSSKPIRPEEREMEGTISHDNSIHSALKEIRSALKKPIKDSIEILDGIHNKDPKYYGITKKCLLEKLNQNFEEYLKIKQEQQIKLITTKLIRRAINNIKRSRNYISAIKNLKQAIFVINSIHKVEKIYTNEYYLQRQYERCFEDAYKNVFNNFETSYSKQEIFDMLNNDKIHKERVFANYKIKVGHIVNRRELYNKTLHNLAMSNNDIQQDNIRQQIVNSRRGRIDVKNSIFETFVQNIKSLNKEEGLITQS